MNIEQLDYEEKFNQRRKKLKTTSGAAGWKNVFSKPWSHCGLNLYAVQELKSYLRMSWTIDLKAEAEIDVSPISFNYELESVSLH